MTQYKTRQFGDRYQLGVLDIETIAPATPDGSFPPWPLHLTLVASVLTATLQRYGEWRFAIESVNFQSDEAAAIERVSHLIENRRLITFNGREFDNPVLALTEMKHQKFEIVGMSAAWQSHRFSG